MTKVKDTKMNIKMKEKVVVIIENLTSHEITDKSIKTAKMTMVIVTQDILVNNKNIYMENLTVKNKKVENLIMKVDSKD